MNPLQVPQQGPLWRDLSTSRAFFYMSLEFLIKVLLIKTKFHHSLEGPCREVSPPPMFPKMGPLWKQTTISGALLSLSFGDPSKGALPPVSPHTAVTERAGPFPQPSFIYLLKSLVYEPTSRFPSGAPIERKALLHILQGHQ